MKACRDCRYGKVTPSALRLDPDNHGWDWAICEHPKARSTTPKPHLGGKAAKGKLMTCWIMRSIRDECGEDAKLFEPKAMTA